MVTTDDEELAWQARSFRDHGYDVKERLNLLELEQKLPYIHNMVGWNYRMTEMQSAIGLAELDRMDNWNMPARRRNAEILIDAAEGVCRRSSIFPVDTPERRNGWYVMAFSLDIENMRCDIQEFVEGGGRRGRAGVEGVLAAVPHRTRLPASTTPLAAPGSLSRRRSTPTPPSVDYTQVDVPNARWHEKHTFTCFAYPTYHRR